MSAVKLFFMIQQPLFAPDTAAETDQFAVTADHAVAGNNHLIADNFKGPDF
jgi:hypothetical protein